MQWKHSMQSLEKNFNPVWRVTSKIGHIPGARQGVCKMRSGE
jgi:hypothetical protein